MKILKQFASLLMRQWSFSSYFATALIILAAGFLMSERQAMSPNWTGPYLSCAANLKFGGMFLVDVDDTSQFLDLDEKAAEFNYKFSESENLKHYNHNPIGYAYIINIATTVFPMVGDMRAVVWLQICSHTCCCLLVLLILKSGLQKSLFVIVYGLNPLVLYVTGINFYYFWQVIPATVLLVVYLLFWRGNHREKIATPLIIAISAITGLGLGLIFVARPTILGFIVLGCVLLLFKKETRIHGFLPMAFCFCVAVIAIWQPTQKNFWHTVFVGIGAYPNRFVTELSDQQGYSLFAESTGKKLNSSFGGNYYDVDTIQEYQNIAKTECLELAQKEPFMFFRNAALNTLQGFSIGYLNDFSYLIHLLMSGIGFLIIVGFFYYKEWFVLASCFAGLLTFTPYYPPIQAYMFGNYILLAYGFISTLDSICNKDNTSKRSDYKGSPL